MKFNAVYKNDESYWFILELKNNVYTIIDGAYISEIGMKIKKEDFNNNYIITPFKNREECTESELLDRIRDNVLEDL